MMEIQSDAASGFSRVPRPSARSSRKPATCSPTTAATCSGETGFKSASWANGPANTSRRCPPSLPTSALRTALRRRKNPRSPPPVNERTVARPDLSKRPRSRRAVARRRPGSGHTLSRRHVRRGFPDWSGTLGPVFCAPPDRSDTLRRAAQGPSDRTETLRTSRRSLTEQPDHPSATRTKPVRPVRPPSLTRTKGDPVAPTGLVRPFTLCQTAPIHVVRKNPPSQTAPPQHVAPFTPSATASRHHGALDGPSSPASTVHK